MSSKRGGKGEGRKPGGASGGPPREVLVSKKISWLLRHGAEKEGLKLGQGGYVNVRDALNTRALKSLHVTFDEVRSVVENNDKQRFNLIPISEGPDTAQPTSPSNPPTNDIATASHDDGDHASNPSPTTPPDPSDPSQYLIRANQGHSLKVASEELLHPIATPADLPPLVVHGTTTAAWPQILATGGLKKMTRTHVHFAPGLPASYKSVEDADYNAAGTATSSQDPSAATTRPPVISGMRASSSVLIFLDAAKAMTEGGLTFWKSDNGVILCEGDERGVIPLRFFKRVEQRTGGGRVLVRDGEVVGELIPGTEREGQRAGGGGGGKKGGRGKGKERPRVNVEKEGQIEG